MRQFTEAITQSLQDKNWYAALFLSLAIPDICRSVENPKPERGEIGKLYANWFDRYLGQEYSSGEHEETRFYGYDCWMYRCSCMHSGLDFLDKKRLRLFVFTPPPAPGYIVHRNSIDNKLQLQIDCFCKDILDAVDKWMLDIKGKETYLQRMNSLLTISTAHYTPSLLS
ncbi:hypothetical protein [Erwinia aphidicola]|uniref:hypothetical protein n=1 Tax=Erwinia aphidicola TaxID=68334 RepID=UPI0020A19F49|nr:hypothetical protein [Erwinia aphidicola]MCP2232868.1 hypothetical protein [Erwinia aphidicola]